LKKETNDSLKNLAPTEKSEIKVFSKAAFFKSSAFKDKKDLISVLLDDDKLYSKKEVEGIINNYLKRRGL